MIITAETFNVAHLRELRLTMRLVKRRRARTAMQQEVAGRLRIGPSIVRTLSNYDLAQAWLMLRYNVTENAVRRIVWRALLGWGTYYARVRIAKALGWRMFRCCAPDQRRTRRWRYHYLVGTVIGIDPGALYAELQLQKQLAAQKGRPDRVAAVILDRTSIQAERK